MTRRVLTGLLLFSVLNICLTVCDDPQVKAQHVKGFWFWVDTAGVLLGLLLGAGALSATRTLLARRRYHRRHP